MLEDRERKIQSKGMNMSKRVRLSGIVSLCIGLSLILSACDKGKKPYEEAEALFNKSDYAAAKKKAEEASMNANSKYHDQAKALYEKIEKIEASINRANDAAQIGDYASAIKSSEETLALDSNNTQAKEALPKMREASQRKDKLLEEGNAFMESAEYDKAEKTYKEILAVNDKDKDANAALKRMEHNYPACCRDGINRYKARMQSLSGIRDIFSKEPSSDNEFERKREAEEIKGQKKVISRDHFFFGYEYSPHISEYNFRNHEYKISFGVQEGTRGGEALGIPNSPDVVQIANEQGQRLTFTLKMNKEEAETFDKEQKAHAQLFIIYKFIRGERFTYWNPLKAAAMRESGLRGNHGDEKDTRIYIKPVYVALLSGDKKIVLFDSR